MIEERVLGKFIADPDYYTKLNLRLQYGVSWEGASLCSIEGVGAKFASRMIDEGINSLVAVVKNRKKILTMFGSRRGHRIVSGAAQFIKGARHEH